MKPFPSHMKERDRYMAFELVCSSNVSQQDATKAIWDAVFRGIGSLGAADASFWLIDYDPAQKKGILRVKNTKIHEIRASIAMLDNIGSNPAFVRFTTTTGTIAKARSRNA